MINIIFSSIKAHSKGKKKLTDWPFEFGKKKAFASATAPICYFNNNNNYIDIMIQTDILRVPSFVSSSNLFVRTCEYARRADPCKVEQQDRLSNKLAPKNNFGLYYYLARWFVEPYGVVRALP